MRLLRKVLIAVCITPLFIASAAGVMLAVLGAMSFAGHPVDAQRVARIGKRAATVNVLALVQAHPKFAAWQTEQKQKIEKLKAQKGKEAEVSALEKEPFPEARLREVYSDIAKQVETLCAENSLDLAADLTEAVAQRMK